VSIDYDEYFEVVSIVPLFFSTLHIFGVALYFQNIRAQKKLKQSQNTKYSLKLFSKLYKIGLNRDPKIAQKTKVEKKKGPLPNM
jgi:hypothetical protein